MPPTRTRDFIEGRLREDGACLVWTGALDHKGYGRLIFNGQWWAIHRLVWTWNYGPIPDGLFVLHSCDNPACARPDHLFLGTHQDNMDDMMKKGRSSDQRGARNANAKLTPKQVVEIRSAKGSQESIARRYGITQSMVSKIKLRRNWA